MTISAPIVFTNPKNYSDIADAIRAKNGTSTTYRPEEMASAIMDITPAFSGTITLSQNGTFSVGGYASASVSVPDNPYAARWTDNANFTTFTDESVTTIPYGTFAYTLNLANVSFPSATTIGSYAFGYCFKLANGSFPEVATISQYAFQYCSSFRSGQVLNSTVFPKVKGTLGAYAFRGCQYLTGVDLSLVTTVGAQAFSACSRITNVNMAGVTSTGGGAFSYLTTCTSYSLPNLQTVGSSTFYSNWALQTLTLPACTKISAYAFRYCSKMMSLYLPGSSIPTLASTTVFANMPMSVSVNNVYGSIYVPSTMVDSYKAATVWKTYAARIVAIPE